MNFQIQRDSKGQPYLSQSTIYHFYGVKVRDFFSLWIQQDHVVKAPPRHIKYLNMHISEAISIANTYGYKYEII